MTLLAFLRRYRLVGAKCQSIFKNVTVKDHLNSKYQTEYVKIVYLPSVEVLHKKDNSFKTSIF